MKRIGDSPEFKSRKNIILKGFDPVSSKGFTQVPNVILTQQGLSVGAKLAYAMLLKYAWQNDFCYPGQVKLGKDLGVKQRQVRNYLSELATSGYVSVKRRGLGKTNIYILYATVKK